MKFLFIPVSGLIAVQAFFHVVENRSDRPVFELTVYLVSLSFVKLACVYGFQERHYGTMTAGVILRFFEELPGDPPAPAVFTYPEYVDFDAVPVNAAGNTAEECRVLHRGEKKSPVLRFGRQVGELAQYEIPEIVVELAKVGVGRGEVFFDLHGRV